MKDTVVVMWHRLMDAVDPQLLDELETTVGNVAGVERVGGIKGRWVGHRFHVDVQIVVNEDLATRESYQVVEAVRHALQHKQPRLETISVQIIPCGHSHAAALHQMASPA